MYDQGKQIKPLNRTVTPIWERDTSDYPDIIRVPMENGRVISYRREIEQLHPKCAKAIDLIRIINENTYGGYVGRHEKKTAGGCSSSPTSARR